MELDYKGKFRLALYNRQGGHLYDIRHSHNFTDLLRQARDGEGNPDGFLWRILNAKGDTMAAQRRKPNAWDEKYWSDRLYFYADF